MSFDKSYLEPVYLISEVSTILNIHPQTLRQYEREGLLTPSRTDGKIRLYSQKDIDTIRHILYLTRTKGVNIAGVSIILQMEQQLTSMEAKIAYYQEQQYKKECSKALVVQKSQYDIVVFK